MKDINEVIISGVINNITDNNKQYIKFGLTTIKNDNGKVYTILNIYRNLYEIYKDFFIKENKVYIRGYLNSYVLDNKIQSFITVVNIANNYDDILKNRKTSHIRYDYDGIEVWDGKRCESDIATGEEIENIKKMLGGIQNER